MPFIIPPPSSHILVNCCNNFLSCDKRSYISMSIVYVRVSLESQTYLRTDSFKNRLTYLYLTLSYRILTTYQINIRKAWQAILHNLRDKIIPTDTFIKDNRIPSDYILKLF